MDTFVGVEKSRLIATSFVGLCIAIVIFFVTIWLLMAHCNRLSQKRALAKEELAEDSSEILMNKSKTKPSAKKSKRGKASPAPTSDTDDNGILRGEVMVGGAGGTAGVKLLSQTLPDKVLTVPAGNSNDPYTTFLTTFAKNFYPDPTTAADHDLGLETSLVTSSSFFLPPAMPADGDDFTAQLTYKDYFTPEGRGAGADGTILPNPDPIPLKRLASYVNLMKSGPDSFRAEHSLLPAGHIKPCEVGCKAVNANRNRYSNVLPYDETRVKLEPTTTNPDGYINANYVDGYGCPAAYVATQGPLKEYLADFWLMVWQENCPKIVMLTRLVENKVDKCDKYWPNLEQAYGSVTVKVLKTNKTADYVIIDLELSHRSVGDEKRVVRLYWFLAWPDHGVPTKTTEFLSFYYFVKAYEVPFTGPTVVHCSAGVGRTGTFIALDSMIDMAKDRGSVDLFGYLKKIRGQRCNMVQSAEQYAFLYESVLEALTSGGTFVSLQNAHDYFTSICSVDIATDKTFLEEQWKVLGTMAPSVTFDPYRLIHPGRFKENSTKNRDIKVLPKDNRRPILKTVGGYRLATDYINASFVNGYDLKDRYIVTQWPIADTRIDLWKMIWENDIRTIVLLYKHGQIGNQTSSNLREDLYWPSLKNQDKEGLVEEEGSRLARYYGMFYVELINTSMVLNAEFGKVMAIRTFKLANLLPSSKVERSESRFGQARSLSKTYMATYAKGPDAQPPADDGDYKIVKQFQLLCWKNREEAPPSPLAIQETIERSNLWQRVVSETEDFGLNPSADLSTVSTSFGTGGRHRPILVQDYDGYSKAGLYLACCHLYDQIRVENGLNMYLAVKSIRADRAEFVTSFLQYQFIYKFAWQQVLLTKFQPEVRPSQQGTSPTTLNKNVTIEGEPGIEELTSLEK